LKLLFIEPKDSRRPTGCDAARPSAHHLLLVQLQQFADRRRRPEHPGGTGDVPADIVVIGIDRVADPALGLDAEHQRVEKLLARHRLQLRQRENG
jgi:hypothetical protein